MGLGKLLKGNRHKAKNASESGTVSKHSSAEHNPVSRRVLSQESLGSGSIPGIEGSPSEVAIASKGAGKGRITNFLMQMKHVGGSNTNLAQDHKGDGPAHHPGPDKEGSLLPNGHRFFKIVVLGAGGVGKTSFIENFVDGNAFEFGTQTPTVEDTMEKVVKIEQSKVVLHIVDTAGEEPKEGALQSYIKRANAFILLYSPDVEKTFLLVETLALEIENVRGKDVPIFVVGNKLDIVKEKPELRKVSEERLQQFGQVRDYGVMEFSCKDGDDGSKPFLILSRQLIASMPFKEKIAAIQKKQVRPGLKGTRKMSIQMSAL
eukprot:Nk52_evm42s222 gene=Nk52_evmTU42s222